MFSNLPIWMQYISVLSFVILYIYSAMTCPTSTGLALSLALLFTGACNSLLAVKYGTDLIRIFALFGVIGLGLLSLAMFLFLLLISYGGLVIPAIQLIACPIFLLLGIGVYFFLIRPTSVGY